MRYELRDYEWSLIKPMLLNKSRGIPRVDDRRLLNGIFRVFRTLRRGAICPKAAARTPLAAIASFAGGGQVSGTE
jgi:transposase